MSMPAPMAAATGSSMRKTFRAPEDITVSMTARLSTSVMAEGTQTQTRGLKNLLEQTFLKKSLSISSVTS